MPSTQSTLTPPIPCPFPAFLSRQHPGSYWPGPSFATPVPPWRTRAHTTPGSGEMFVSVFLTCYPPSNNEADQDSLVEENCLPMSSRGRTVPLLWWFQGVYIFWCHLFECFGWCGTNGWCGLIFCYFLHPLNALVVGLMIRWMAVVESQSSTSTLLTPELFPWKMTVYLLPSVVSDLATLKWNGKIADSQVEW